MKKYEAIIENTPILGIGIMLVVGFAYTIATAVNPVGCAAAVSMLALGFGLAVGAGEREQHPLTLVAIGGGLIGTAILSPMHLVFGFA